MSIGRQRCPATELVVPWTPFDGWPGQSIRPQGIGVDARAESLVGLAVAVSCQAGRRPSPSVRAAREPHSFGLRVRSGRHWHPSCRAPVQAVAASRWRAPAGTRAAQQGVFRPRDGAAAHWPRSKATLAEKAGMTTLFTAGHAGTSTGNCRGNAPARTPMMMPRSGRTARKGSVAARETGASGQASRTAQGDRSPCLAAKRSLSMRRLRFSRVATLEREIPIRSAVSLVDSSWSNRISTTWR